MPLLQKARSISKPVPSTQKTNDQARNNTNSADNSNNNNGNSRTNFNSNKEVSNKNNANNTNNQKNRTSRPVYPPFETCGRTNHSTENCYLGAKAANRPPPRNRRPEGQNQVQQRNVQSNSDENVQAAAQTLNWESHVSTPELCVTDGRQLKCQNFHHFTRLSGRNPWRHLQINVT